MENLINVQYHKTIILANTLVKIYPTKTKIYFYKSKQEIKQDGWESSRPNKHNKATKTKSLPEDVFRSLRRTKTTISDIVQCNRFDYFVTFTFKSERDNVDKCKSKLSGWLKRERKRQPNSDMFRYLIVPEYHKDGKSLHFHALITGELKLKPTKIFQKGRRVYNIENYRSGFTTAVKIDNIEKVSSYIKKYITKDMPQFSGKKRYWNSKHLIRPESHWTTDDLLNLSTDLKHVYSTLNYELYELPVKVQVLN